MVAFKITSPDGKTLSVMREYSIREYMSQRDSVAGMSLSSCTSYVGSGPVSLRVAGVLLSRMETY